MGLWYTIFPKTDVQLGVKRVLTSQGIGLGVSTATLRSVKLRPLRERRVGARKLTGQGCTRGRGAALC